jgi:bud site selection protein 20
MGGSQRRKGMKGKNKGVHRALKTKHYLRDHDQIHDDLKNPQKYGAMEIDEAKPGSGQFYCIGCARYF